MLTPEYLASFSSGYLGMVDALNEQIVRDISRRMVKAGKVTDTAKWQIKQAQESGKLLDDIVRDAGKFTGYSDKQIKKMFKEAGIIGLKNDAKDLIEAGVVSGAKLSKNMSDLLLANAKKTSGNINNLTLTTAAKSLELYIQSLNEALLKVQSGAFSYQEALKYAIRKAAQTGGMVLYESGMQMSLDAALRMALLTGLNQTAATLTEIYAAEMGAEYYETTAHSGARLEHTYWQGQVFKIEGEGGGYRNFYDATGYGTVTGLCGANCRHSFHPFWPGISKPAYSKDMLDDYSAVKFSYGGKGLTEYECSQIQRRFERAIRESKRILAGYDSAVKSSADSETEQYLKDEFQKESVKLKQREKKLKDFCSETGRSVDTARTQVYAVKDQNGNVVNFGRSTSMKAVWANRKAKK
ncbi:MAG: phage minor capsid protein [Blautia sp.]